MLIESLGVIPVCSHQQAVFKQSVLPCLPVGRCASEPGLIPLPPTAARPGRCQRHSLMSECQRIRSGQQVFSTRRIYPCAMRL